MVAVCSTAALVTTAAPQATPSLSAPSSRKTSEPVVGGWIRENLGPRGMLDDAREGVQALVSLARQIPDLAHRTERLTREIDRMAENGLRFDDETARACGRCDNCAGQWFPADIAAAATEATSAGKAVLANLKHASRPVVAVELLDGVLGILGSFKSDDTRALGSAVGRHVDVSADDGTTLTEEILQVLPANVVGKL